MFFFLFFFLVYFLLALTFLLTFFFGSVSLNFYLFSLAGAEFSFGFLLDYVSISFFASVSFISCMGFFYSVFYMGGTVDMRRFFWLVFGFVLSMGLLVFSGSFLTLMVGWDGLGLISFCLVVFYSNYSSIESGLITVFSNRVGDVFFLGSMVFLFLGGSGLSDSLDFLSGLLFSFLFLGAITKSAQFPFSAWLPAAMAAPTPVSSLVHSSTLVTAGVYVLLRFHYLFLYFNMLYMKVFFILTMVLAGVCANLEMDFKKIVAMSTLSQLGLMMFVMSVGGWLLAFIHMIIHAFFKSLLFMSTGSLMNNFSGGQDSRIYGGDYFSSGTFMCFVVSGFCLMGFPFFVGFYSKDMIILTSSVSLGGLFYFVFLLGCFLTIGYSLRVLKEAFSTRLLSTPFLCFVDTKIFLGSVFFLFMKSWILGGAFFSLFIFDLSVTLTILDVSIGLGLLLLAVYFKNFIKVLKLLYKASCFFFMIGYFRWLSTSGASSSFSSYKSFRWDGGWLEMSGGQGVYLFLENLCFFDLFRILGLGFIFFISSVLLCT